MFSTILWIVRLVNDTVSTADVLLCQMRWKDVHKRLIDKNLAEGTMLAFAWRLGKTTKNFRQNSW
jgi:hypothetical protein